MENAYTDPITGKFTKNNPGRPEGATGKMTAEVKEMIVEFVHRNLEKVQQQFDAIEAKDQIKSLSGLLEYVIPKQREIKGDFNIKTDTVYEAPVIIDEVESQASPSLPEHKD